jgi:hypothetical protein
MADGASPQSQGKGARKLEPCSVFLLVSRELDRTCPFGMEIRCSEVESSAVLPTSSRRERPVAVPNGQHESCPRRQSWV